MKKALLEFSRTHLIILLGFITISLVYLSPLLDGKVLQQSDMTQVAGMSQELKEYHEETGEYSQWTNSMFSGMPAFHVGPAGAKKTVFSHFANVLRFGISLSNPFAIFFIYLICFYVLLLSLRLSPWVSAIGAIAFALSSYNIIIIEVGHINKAYAIAFMAPVIAGLLLTYRGKHLAGGLLFLLGLGLQLYSNHLQITYYLLITTLIIVLTKLVFAIKEKEIKKFLVASGILMAAALLALLPNISSLWVNYEISKQSMRGQPELTLNQENQTSGLNKDYALSWSYGKAETFSLMIPYFTGGKTGALGENEKAMEKVSPRFRETIQGQNQYWGAKSITSGDNYSGAIVVFFFVLGMLLIKGSMRWWILISTILSILLAWGNNFPALSYFFLDHVPLYNKFRTVEMTLVIACFNIPLMAFLVIDRIRKEPELILNNKKQILVAFGLTGGLSLFFYLVPGLFTFFSAQEQQIFDQQLAGATAQYASQFRDFMDELEAARIYIFRHDAIRSFLFITAAFLLTWFYANKKLKLTWFVAGLGLMIVVDMWTIDKRYLNNDNFITKKQKRNIVASTPADEFILNDPDPHFRVVNLTKSPWQDAGTSYYHKSIGGYHGAKLRRYQDLIEFYLSPGLQNITGVLNSRPTSVQVDSVLSKQQVLNMVNTKYMILNPSSQPLMNRFAKGHAWIVKDYRLVKNADEEIAALAVYDLDNVAVVDERFAGLLSEGLKHREISGSVELTEYRPNYLSYKASLGQESLLLFSDVFYEGGWHASIDGEPAPHLRANYILRALPVDAGEHTIEFKFEFKPFETGEKISLAGSILILLILLGGFGFHIYSTVIRKPE
ncbi:MAG: YfhO family protein [Bacteroidales bacterium]|nr:YfhO family protein [Bacteroidales bacterium]